LLCSARSIAARARSLVVAGCGYGSVAADRQAFRKDAEAVATRLETEGMARIADVYAHGPMRVQFEDKDPLGWREFHAQLAGGSALGHEQESQRVAKWLDILSRRRLRDRDQVWALTDLLATIVLTGPCSLAVRAAPVPLTPPVALRVRGQSSTPHAAAVERDAPCVRP